jgi:hypothetical protein
VGFRVFEPLKPFFSSVVFVVLMRGGGGCAKEVKACFSKTVQSILGNSFVFLSFVVDP